MRWWIRLEGSLRARSGLTVEWGRCDSLPAVAGRVELPPAEWRPLRVELAMSLDVRRDYFYSTLGGAEAVEAAAERLHAARVSLFDWLHARVPPLESDEPLIAVRSPGLLELPLSSIVADARPERAFARHLPFDVHPSVSEATALAELCATPFPTPTPKQLTIFVGADLNETATPDGIRGEHLAAVVIWRLQIERAVTAAEQQGARVVRGFTLDELLRALEGGFGPYLQVIAESPLVATPDGDERCLLASDEAISLSTLRQFARERTVGPSKLIAADLVTCDSADDFASSLASLGVRFLSSATNVWHPAYVAALLQHLYGHGGAIDGRTWLAHAWIIASKRLYFETTTGLPGAQSD